MKGNEVRVTITACCLLFGAAAVAQQPSSDAVVGKAVFDVQRSVGGHAWVTPKTPLVFGITRLTQSGADLPEGTAICKLVKRVIGHDEKLNADITVTILKCGEYEYGISEVMFEDSAKR